MSSNLPAEDVERLMAEAEELVQRIGADVRNELEEEHRLQFELHARNLEKIKSEVQDGTDKKKTSKKNTAPRACTRRFRKYPKRCANWPNT